eukprot:gene5665-4055_t
MNGESFERFQEPPGRVRAELRHFQNFDEDSSDEDDSSASSSSSSGSSCTNESIGNSVDEEAHQFNDEECVSDSSTLSHLDELMMTASDSENDSDSEIIDDGYYSSDGDVSLDEGSIGETSESEWERYNESHQSPVPELEESAAALDATSTSTVDTNEDSSDEDSSDEDSSAEDDSGGSSCTNESIGNSVDEEDIPAHRFNDEECVSDSSTLSQVEELMMTASDFENDSDSEIIDDGYYSSDGDVSLDEDSTRAPRISLANLYSVSEERQVQGVVPPTSAVHTAVVERRHGPSRIDPAKRGRELIEDRGFEAGHQSVATDYVTPDTVAGLSKLITFERAADNQHERQSLASELEATRSRLAEVESALQEQTQKLADHERIHAAAEVNHQQQLHAQAAQLADRETQ